MLEKYLQEIGLSEKEAQVYLALLQVDNESIQDLAKRTGINRTTVYPLLESLGKKGLVSEVQLGKKMNYEAAPPERLETFIERQKVILIEKSKRLKDIIPELKGIERKEGERPIVKFFEGRDGAISAYEEFYAFDPNKEATGGFIFNRDLLAQTFTREERAKFLSIRVGKEVKPLSVYNNQAGDVEFITQGMRKRIDEKKYPILCDISVVEDRVVITTLGDNVSAFLIRSKNIAETLKSLILKINE